MAPDEFPDDPTDTLRRAWQGQPGPAAPPSLDDVRRRAGQFSRRMLWRNAIEYAAGAFVIPLVAVDIVRGGFNGLVDVGNVLLILGCSYVLFHMYRSAAARALPGEIGMVDALSFHRAEIARQRDLLTSVWRWYLLPFMPGIVVVLIGRGVARPEQWPRAAGTLVGALALAVFIDWVNRRAAQRLQRDIDALDRLASGAETTLAGPEPPSLVERLTMWAILAFSVVVVLVIVAQLLGLIPPTFSWRR